MYNKIDSEDAKAVGTLVMVKHACAQKCHSPYKLLPTWSWNIPITAHSLYLLVIKNDEHCFPMAAYFQKPIESPIIRVMLPCFM
jgi:hypothetical protein